MDNTNNFRTIPVSELTEQQKSQLILWGTPLGRKMMMEDRLMENNIQIRENKAKITAIKNELLQMGYTMQEIEESIAEKVKIIEEQRKNEKLPF